MIKLIIFSIYLIGSISYRGLASDFAICKDKIWVSYPEENFILNYQAGFKIIVKKPYALFSSGDTLFFVSNNILFAYTKGRKAKLLDLPPGFYIRGLKVKDTLYLLERESSKILKIYLSANGIEQKGISFPLYKPRDFILKNRKFYVLERGGPAPKIRIIAFDLSGSLIDTIFEKIGTIGGGIVFDDEGNLLVSDALYGKIYKIFPAKGTIIDSFGNYGSDSLEFKTPTRLIWKNKKLYILNERNSRIDIFAYQIIKIDEKPFEGIESKGKRLFLNIIVPPGVYELSIFSVDGRKIKVISGLNSLRGKIEKKLNLNIKPGVYFVILKEKSGKFFIKKGVKIK